MKDVFISGWSGFPILFGEFSLEFEFVVPFITHSLQDIEEIADRGGRNLFAWSTGAYLMLDREEKPDFENIVLAAPFLKFTDYTPARVLEKMMKRFVDFPAETLEDFFKRCGAHLTPEYNPKHFHILLHGLKFLMNSDIDEVEWDLTGVKLLHGTEDLIVNPQASFDIAAKFGGDIAEVRGAGHLIPGEIMKNHMI